jgi:hypothetical protein
VILRSSAAIVGPFDPMELADATGGRPLSAMAYWAVSQSGLTAELKICARTLIRYDRTVFMRAKTLKYAQTSKLGGLFDC